MNDGDWICCDPQCSNVNFARRTSCNRCGKGNSEKAAVPPRKKLGHEIGKAAAEKSRGLFSADDWQCGRCGNVNWARRQQCNMCNAPKFGEVEERTGLGGGYNERENVEYIERDESDGEYDDFGRKKKKYRGSDEPPIKGKSNPADQENLEEEEKITTKYNEEEEEEEDDDDDDSADLSKYDLSGWGDDSPKKEEDKRSRSRSRSSSSSRSTTSLRSRSTASLRSRSSSKSSRSSRSPSPSSSDSDKLSRSKRTHSRSRSSSTEVNHIKKRKRSRSPLHISSSRSRDRSDSSSPASHKR